MKNPILRVKFNRMPLNALLLGLAACVLTACSTPQKFDGKPTMYDMIASSNIERIDGGVTYVNRVFLGSGSFYRYPPRYLRYPPYWMGGYGPYFGYGPYYSLYYPYYGYRPHYVWSCPLTPQRLHPYGRDPFPLNRVGEPLYNVGSEQPSAPVGEINPVSPIYTGPVGRPGYAILQPEYRRSGNDPYRVSNTNNRTISRPVTSAYGTKMGLTLQPRTGSENHGFQRPEPRRNVNTNRQPTAPAFGNSVRGSSLSRPARANHRVRQPSPSRSSAVRSSGVASIRPQAQH